MCPGLTRSGLSKSDSPSRDPDSPSRSFCNVGGRGEGGPTAVPSKGRRTARFAYLMQQVWPVAADGLVQEFTRLQEMHDTCDRASRRSENLWVCVVFMSVLDAGTGLPSANVMVRCLGAVG